MGMHSNNARLVTTAPAGAAVATADTFRRFWRRTTNAVAMHRLKAQARSMPPGHPVAMLIEAGDWDTLDWLCDELYGPATRGKGAA